MVFLRTSPGYNDLSIKELHKGSFQGRGISSLLRLVPLDIQNDFTSLSKNKTKNYFTNLRQGNFDIMIYSTN